MTSTVTANVRDVTGVPDNSRWRFSSILHEGADGIITAKVREVQPVGGVLTAELEPGPATVSFGGKNYSISVPDADADLWDLIEAAVAAPPNTSAQALAAAIETYLDTHPAGAVDDATITAAVNAYLAANPVTAGEVVDDPSPQLGGDLDLNGHNVGAATAADLTKLHSTGSLSGNNTGDQDVSGKEDVANKGAASGYAPLDSSQLIPSIYLPSYVDDVLEFANLSAFPGTGTTGKIYVALDTNKTWRWSGSAYVEISSSPGSTDQVTEGATNLYYPAADKAKLAGIAAGAEANVNADWNAVSGDALILNKPAIGGGGDVTLNGAQTLTQKTIGDDLKFATLGAGTTPTTPAAGTVKLYTRTGVSNIEAMAYVTNLGVPVVIGRDICVYARNNSGAIIAKGSAVYVSSATSSTINIAKAQADATMTKLPVFGIVAADIANGAYGIVMQRGVISNLNTSALTGNASIWVDPTTAGALTTTMPTHPNIAELVGIVINTSASIGSILVAIEPSITARNQGVNGASYAIGDGTGASARSVLFKNANTGTLSWTPTAARTITLPDATGTVALRAKRVVTVTSSATPTFDTDAADQAEMLTLATNISGATFSGTPTNAQVLTLVFKSAAPQTINLGTSVVAGPAPLLSATVAGRYHEVVLKWNSTAAKWVTMASDAAGYV